MILPRAQLPKWFKPMPEIPQRFVVHRLDGEWIWEYSFEFVSGDVRLAGIRWATKDGAHCGGISDPSNNPTLPPEVLIAAGLEAQQRAGRHPAKSPFWWVVKDDDLYCASGYLVPDQWLAARYTDRREAEHAATGVPGRRVVRVRARGAA